MRVTLPPFLRVERRSVLENIIISLRKWSEQFEPNMESGKGNLELLIGSLFQYLVKPPQLSE